MKWHERGSWCTLHQLLPPMAFAATLKPNNLDGV